MVEGLGKKKRRKTLGSTMSSSSENSSEASGMAGVPSAVVDADAME